MLSNGCRRKSAFSASLIKLTSGCHSSASRLVSTPSCSRRERSTKQRSDFVTAIWIHAKALKHGYAANPAISSYVVLTYVQCRNVGEARKILEEALDCGFDLLTLNLIVAELMKIGEVGAAVKVFDKMYDRDAVTWNTVIGGCVRNKRVLEGLKVFREMLRLNVEPDGFTFASVMAGCARLGDVRNAQWVHGLMVEKGIELNFILSSALIDMYSKCGRIEAARDVFDGVQHDSVCVYNALINGLAIHGRAGDAIMLLGKMELECVLPDAITFVGVLKACCHGGLVEKGRQCFKLMSMKYLIQPQLEHYGAMVDLLGRAGLLEEAFDVVETMPMEPDVVMWRTILGACRTYKKPELGELVMAKISQLKSGDYVLLSNTYCSMNKWETAAKLRASMTKKRVRKVKGRSWIEVAGSTHHFKAGDQTNPKREPIYKVLEELIKRVKSEGFVPSTELVLMDVSEEEKERTLNYHSEKLAVAFGVLKTNPGEEIRISKNLRTCYDCHSWMKIVAKVLNRVIIVRDRKRFHRFEGGQCSCRDYW